jgi:hypothetical protein
MRASIDSHSKGCLSLQMDAEAARAVFASIVFAARFHPAIAPLVNIAERCLNADPEHHLPGRTSCR